MALAILGPRTRAFTYSGHQRRRGAARIDSGVIRPAVAYTLIAAAANVVGAAAVTSRSRWSFSGPRQAHRAFCRLHDLRCAAGPDSGGDRAAWAGARTRLYSAGIVLVHLTQHTLTPHFHFGEEVHEVTRAVSVSALIGLLLHTFVDGVAIASGFEVRALSLDCLSFWRFCFTSCRRGWRSRACFSRPVLREARALASGRCARCCDSDLVAWLTEYFAPLRMYGLALAAGVALYVGASNLVPEFQGKKGWGLPVSFFAGCALYLLARNLMQVTIGLNDGITEPQQRGKTIWRIIKD